MADLTFGGAIGAYALLVCFFALANLLFNVLDGRVRLRLGVIGAHFLAAAIAEIVFIVVFVLIFWIHRGAAWWIGCVVASVIGTGVLTGALSSQR